MSWTGKVRIRRIETTFFFEHEVSPGVWQNLKQVDLPFSSSVYPVVVSEGANPSDTNVVTLRSEL